MRKVENHKYSFRLQQGTRFKVIST
eukprot:UN15991